MKSKGGSVWVSAHVRIRAGARGNPYRDQYRDIIVLLGVFVLLGVIMLYLDHSSNSIRIKGGWPDG